MHSLQLNQYEILMEKIPAKLTTHQIDCPFVAPFMKLCKALPAKL